MIAFLIIAAAIATPDPKPTPTWLGKVCDAKYGPCKVDPSEPGDGPGCRRWSDRALAISFKCPTPMIGTGPAVIYPRPSPTLLCAVIQPEGYYRQVADEECRQGIARGGAR